MTFTRIALAAALAFAGLAAHAQDLPPVTPNPAEAPPVPPATATPAVTSAVPSQSNIENSVVKIFATLSRPDPYKPWTKASPVDASGSGVVIEGKRIITNAHVVGYASQVQVQANQSGDKVTAKVVAIARGIDLAVLELEDASFFDKRKPLERAAALPAVREQVFAYGYPVGGAALSITKGIVSRIEFANYGYPTSGLRIQVDAPINPGNSGGPVIAGDKMIGLAFGGVVNTQNIGYIIPNEEIELFLRDVADGRYDGKPTLQDDLQALENPAMRDYLKLTPAVTGAVVRRPAFSDASYPLKEWDVITHIGDTPIDNQGMIRTGQNLHVRFQYAVPRVAAGGKVPLTIVRAGKTMKVQVPVSVQRKLLVSSLDGQYPSYFVYGPIVFTRVTAEFVAPFAGNVQAMNALTLTSSPLVTRRGEYATAEREEMVAISAPFFAHRSMNGYGNRFGAVIQSVGGTPVKSLAHLVTLLRDAKEELITLRFEMRSAETMVVRRKEMVEITEKILDDNSIRQQGSSDMMAIWKGK